MRASKSKIIVGLDYYGNATLRGVWYIITEIKTHKRIMWILWCSTTGLIYVLLTLFAPSNRLQIFNNNS